MSEILSLNKISFSYPDQTKAINEISMIIESGSHYSLIGHNGAGKSTLFLLLTGILKPQHGELYFNSQLYQYQEKKLQQLRSQIGLVMQNPDWQLFNPTVEREIAYGMHNMGLPKNIIQERTACMLELFDLCSVKDKPPHFLSYGQKKKVCLAAILVMQPRVLILDEPTAGLDKKQTENLLNYLTGLKDISIIMATHDLDFAYTFSTNWLILENGNLIYQGHPAVIDNGLIHQPAVLMVEQALIKKQLIAKSTDLLNSTDKLVKHILNQKDI